MSRPLHGFMDVVHEMKRIQDRMYGEGAGTEDQQKQRTYADAWTPTTEVLSKGDDLLIRAELPGVKPEDIDITFTGGTLTISGQRERTAGEEGGKLLRSGAQLRHLPSEYGLAGKRKRR